LNKYGQRLVKEIAMKDNSSFDVLSASTFYARFRERVKSESFTNNFKEYVGIDQYDDGCDFEVELQGELNQAPKVGISFLYI
jgi:hypothetical protein